MAGRECSAAFMATSPAVRMYTKHSFSLFFFYALGQHPPPHNSRNRDGGKTYFIGSHLDGLTMRQPHGFSNLLTLDIHQ